MNEIRVLLADDHPIVLQGLRTLIEAEHNLLVIGEASNGRETILMVEELNPDVLVLDWMMPIMNGLEVVRALASKAIKTKIIILSLHTSEVYVMDALKAGVFGYVPKDSSEEILIQAINQVYDGEIYLAPPFSKRAIEAYAERAKGKSWDEENDDPFQTLTPREREIFQLIIEDFTNGEIAVKFSISLRTVHSHRAKMMRKLGLKNRTELHSYSVNQGFLASKKND